MELIDRIRKRIEQTASEAHAYAPITRVISEAEVKEILEQEEKKGGWIPASEAPKTGEYILLSFENFSVPMVGRYEEDKNGGAFYIGDEDEKCVEQDIFVNAWMALPKPFRVGANNVHTEKSKTNADRIRNMSDEELAEFLCKVKADYQWMEHEFPSEEEHGEMEKWLQSEAE